MPPWLRGRAGNLRKKSSCRGSWKRLTGCRAAATIVFPSPLRLTTTCLWRAPLACCQWRLASSRAGQPRHCLEFLAVTAIHSALDEIPSASLRPSGTRGAQFLRITQITYYLVLCCEQAEAVPDLFDASLGVQCSCVVKGTQGIQMITTWAYHVHVHVITMIPFGY